MRIVIGTHHYPPTYVAGVELITRRVARWLVAHGHTVEVVCIEQIDADTSLTVETSTDDGVTIHRLGLQLTGGDEPLGLRFRDEGLGRWCEDFFARQRPDLFHSQSCYLLTASPIEAAKRAGIPVVATLHDYWFFCPRHTLLRPDGRCCPDGAMPADCAWCLTTEGRRYRWLEPVRRQLASGTGRAREMALPQWWPVDRRLAASIEQRQTYLSTVLRSIDRLISPAPLARDLLVKRGFPSASIQLVRYGLDVDGWQRPPRVPRPGVLRIGYLGQLMPHKGVHVLIEAFRRLAGSTLAPELHIYGDPSRAPRYATRLRQLASGLTSVHFHGAYDNSQVELLLSGIDVLVVPSLWYEVSPLVIIEAFAAQVPVVASRQSNLQYQIRHEVDGLLFTPGDIGDLTSQLQRLLGDPSLLAELTAGIAPVRTLDEEMAELEGIYYSLTGSRQTCSRTTIGAAH